MIKLTAISYNNQAPLTPLAAVFGRDSGTLGRGEDNYFVLPDPKNLVSRVQASIKSDGSRHTIINLSQANPILLNGKEIDFDREYSFNAGDDLQIGLYVLRAEPHLVAVEGNTVVQAESPTPLFPNILTEIHVPTELEPETEVLRSSVSASSGLIKGSVRPAPNLAALHQRASEASAARTQENDDPNELDDVDAAAYAEPIVSETSANASSVETADDTDNADNELLMQAFLKGAGISDVTLPGLTPEFMETLGKLLSMSVQGTFQLLATRASIKKEVKADQTMVVVRNNNPLKFLSDSETVLAQMLRKKMPGFMGPTEALKDAFFDLQAHQNGMIAGMNGAINEVLKRFDPKSLVKKAKPSSLMDNLFPVFRKATMWDQYDTMFDEINREAQRDYQKLFGKAFVKAYEKEIARSRSEEQED